MASYWNFYVYVYLLLCLNSPLPCHPNANFDKMRTTQTLGDPETGGQQYPTLVCDRNEQTDR